MINMNKIERYYRPISEMEIKKLHDAQQIFSDCYLVSTLNSLTRNRNGIKILKENIKIATDPNYPNYKITFRNIYNKQKDIFITNNEIKLLKLTDKYSNEIPHNIKENNILKAIELSMNKIIKSHPFIKSIFSRIPDCVEPFEYNSPTKFMRIFTGKEPISINEFNLSNTLIKKQDQVYSLFKEIEKSKENVNFIAGTGYFVDHPCLGSWHCYVINKIDTKNNVISLYNQKELETFEMPISLFLRKFKFISGLFNNK